MSDGLVFRVAEEVKMDNRADIAEAALAWFRASQEWQEKSARGEPACYDKVGKMLGELVELCRKHVAGVDQPMLRYFASPYEPEPDGC